MLITARRGSFFPCPWRRNLVIMTRAHERERENEHSFVCRLRDPNSRFLRRGATDSHRKNIRIALRSKLARGDTYLEFY